MRMHVLLTLAVTFGLLGNAAIRQVHGDESENRPNVIVILCDDLGYGDLGCFGHPHIKTPNLDQLAARGTRLTSCYSAAPVCSASRAGLLTGRNPNRCGIYDWLPDGIPVWLKAEETTIPRLLHDAGYRTAMVGKWHLNGQFNSDTQPQPSAYGFDHWMATQNNAAPNHASPTNFVRNGEWIGKQEGYSCQVVASESIQWMESIAGGDKPFYLHVCFHEPHEPVVSPPDIVAQYASVAKDDDQAQYFANVTNMDIAVGRILGALEESGNADNTLVYFSSDNGPETLHRYPSANRSHGSPGPLRGMKLHVYDGGIRVPGIVRFPASFPAGQTIDEPISSVDLLPTICKLAGIESPPVQKIDGSDVSPVLRGEQQTVDRRRPLFWWYYRALTEPRFALRDGKWKLVATWDGPVMKDRVPSDQGSNINSVSMNVLKTSQLSEFVLYDLDNDIGEEMDVSEKYPDDFDRLKKVAFEIYAEVQAESPVWPDTDLYWSKQAKKVKK